MRLSLGNHSNRPMLCNFKSIAKASNSTANDSKIKILCGTISQAWWSDSSKGLLILTKWRFGIITSLGLQELWYSTWPERMQKKILLHIYNTSMSHQIEISSALTWYIINGTVQATTICAKQLLYLHFLQSYNAKTIQVVLEYHFRAK